MSSSTVYSSCPQFLSEIFQREVHEWRCWCAFDCNRLPIPDTVLLERGKKKQNTLRFCKQQFLYLSRASLAALLRKDAEKNQFTFNELGCQSQSRCNKTGNLKQAKEKLWSEFITEFASHVSIIIYNIWYCNAFVSLVFLIVLMSAVIPNHWNLTSSQWPGTSSIHLHLRYLGSFILKNNFTFAQEPVEMGWIMYSLNWYLI